jgi:hypothetical protein
MITRLIINQDPLKWIIPSLAFFAGIVNVFIQYFLSGYGHVQHRIVPWFIFWDLNSGFIGGVIFYLVNYTLFFFLIRFLQDMGIIKITESKRRTKK